MSYSLSLTFFWKIGFIYDCFNDFCFTFYDPLFWWVCLYVFWGKVSFYSLGSLDLTIQNRVDMFSLRSSHWLQTHSDPLTLISQMLGLQVCATMRGCFGLKGNAHSVLEIALSVVTYILQHARCYIKHMFTLLSFGDRVSLCSFRLALNSLCSPDWPVTPASASQVLR